MGNSSDIAAETRSQTIERHTRSMLHDLRTSWETFGQEVVAKYQDRVPEQSRDIDFALTGDPIARALRNSKKLQRYLDIAATVRFPVDLEESWVNALAEPYRSDCRRDLARRYGLLDVPAPDASHVTSVESLANLTMEYSGVLSALSPILEGGGIAQTDLPHIDVAALHLDKIIASATGMLAQLAQQKKRLAGTRVPLRSVS